MMNKIIVTLLALAPSICVATDTLYCSGELYDAEFHVGAEGVFDFTLYKAGDIVIVGARADLAIHDLKWANGNSSSSENFIEVSTKDEFQVPFSLHAKGDEGQIEVENVTSKLACDWLR